MLYSEQNGNGCTPFRHSPAGAWLRCSRRWVSSCSTCLLRSPSMSMIWEQSADYIEITNTACCVTIVPKVLSANPVMADTLWLNDFVCAHWAEVFMSVIYGKSSFQFQANVQLGAVRIERTIQHWYTRVTHLFSMKRSSRYSPSAVAQNSKVQHEKSILQPYCTSSASSALLRARTLDILFVSFAYGIVMFPGNSHEFGYTES